MGQVPRERQGHRQTPSGIRVSLVIRRRTASVGLRRMAGNDLALYDLVPYRRTSGNG